MKCSLWDGAIEIAQWDTTLENYLSFSFPEVLWRQGIMLLNGAPYVVEESIELVEGGRRKWRKNVPVKAVKLREGGCCRD